VKVDTTVLGEKFAEKDEALPEEFYIFGSIE
jgi:hypothetical protein